MRFVQVNFSYPRNYWDAHGDLRNNHTTNAKKVDQPIAGLLHDLKSRGLLDDTLVVWGTRVRPHAGGAGHATAATIIRTPSRCGWPAAASRAACAYGQTDEFGYYVVENKVTMPDFHATILHLLGLDHTKLTFRHAGRDFRLTDVHGEVVHDILKRVGQG